MATDAYERMRSVLLVVAADKARRTGKPVSIAFDGIFWTLAESAHTMPKGGRLVATADPPRRGK